MAGDIYAVDAYGSLNYSLEIFSVAILRASFSVLLNIFPDGDLGISPMKKIPPLNFLYPESLLSIKSNIDAVEIPSSVGTTYA